MLPTISPVVGLREHNILALSFLNVYLLLLEGDMLPGYNAPDFLKRIAVRLLMNKMEGMKTEARSNLKDDEILTIYAAYILGNKLLATSRSEYISGMILQQMPAGHQLKDYKKFREIMIENNTALINSIEEEHSNKLEDFETHKAMLNEFVIE